MTPRKPEPPEPEPEPEEGRAPSPPREDVDRCYARLGHVSSYTGIYRQRFDAKGRGQGIPNSAEGNLDLSQVTRPRLNPVRTLPSPADKKRAAAKGSASRRRGGSKATKDREVRGARRRQQVQRSEEEAEEGEPRRAVCLARTTLRAGVEVDDRSSPRLGTLERGEEVWVLAMARTSDGQPRVRTANGWASIVSRSGQPLLRLVTPVHQRLSNPALFTGVAARGGHSFEKGWGQTLRGAESQAERPTRRAHQEEETSSSNGGPPHAVYAWGAPAGTVLRTPSPRPSVEQPHHGSRKTEQQQDHGPDIVVDEEEDAESEQRKPLSLAELKRQQEEQEQEREPEPEPEPKDSTFGDLAAILGGDGGSDETVDAGFADLKALLGGAPAAESSDDDDAEQDAPKAPQGRRRYSMSLTAGSLDDFLAVVDLPELIEEEESDSTLEVTCPDGVSAGDVIYLQFDGQEIEVTVPEGVEPGDEFDVEVG